MVQISQTFDKQKWNNESELNLFWQSTITNCNAGRMRVIRGVMNSSFLREHDWGGGRHVTHSSHNSTYALFIFSFLFETFPNALTIS